jgi:hypothetical protein
MNDITVCGNYEALVSYLYDECDQAERERIAAHLTMCGSCAEEIGALRDTRAHLASWTPPALPLEFQITRTETEAPAHVLRPAAWWTKPLPAWAQVAAAAVIFVAGMSVNSLRSAPAAPSMASANEAVATARPVISRDDLAELEARLRSLESAQTRAVSHQARTSAATMEDELMPPMTTLVNDRVAQSERRQTLIMDSVAQNLKNDVNEQMDTVQQEQQAMKTVIYAMAKSPVMAPVLRAALESPTAQR